jgi:hypothetical protein
LGYEYGFLCGFYDSHLNEKWSKSGR